MSKFKQKAGDMNEKQRSIMVGTLLGDGHLETQNQGRTYRLKIEHSIKQKEYTNWLYQNFKSWVNDAPKEKKKVVKGNIYTNYYFQTRSVGEFRFYGQIFYDKNGKKVVPDFIDKLLSPLALAVWFMDDGSCKSKQHKALILNTQCFGKKDLKLLIDAFKKRFNIEAKLRTQKEGYQLIIPRPEKFIELILPYLRKEFYYKLGANHINTNA